MGRLEGKVAIITGATSGIGLRTAEVFVAEGARVVVAGRRAAEGEALAARLGPACVFRQTDVTVEDQMQALITLAVEKFGRLVAATPALLLVDSISALGVMECRTDEWHIDVNVTGSQKALMLPPGLAFLSVSDKAWKQIERNPAPRTFYFDLKKARAKLESNDTP